MGELARGEQKQQERERSRFGEEIRRGRGELAAAVAASRGMPCHRFASNSSPLLPSFFFSLLFWIAVFQVQVLPVCDAAAKSLPSSERLALLTLNNSVTDSLGVLNWNSPNPCEWIGITCSEDGHVHAIDLNGLVQLSGSIPPEIGNLSYLVKFSMPTTNLSKEFPEELYKLERLEHLDISSNSLSGKLSEKIRNWKNLRYLYMNSNLFTGSIPSQISGLKRLEHMRLETNGFSGEIPPQITELESLVELDLSLNNFSGPLPNGFSNLKHLSSLSVYRNSLSGPIPSDLGGASNLSSLHFGTNNLSSSIPPELGNLTQLTSLTLSNNQLTGEIPTELEKLPLVTLLLGSNSLEGTIPGNLFESLCPILKNLDLSSNNFSGGIPAQLDLCDFDYLYLQSNRFTGSIPSSLNASTFLASNNALNGTIPSTLVESPTLISLDLSDNELDGLLPKFNCTSLQSIFLSGNSFSGNLSDTIFHCGFLVTANLSLNQFTGSLPPLAALPLLQTLDLQANFLSGPLGEDIASLTSLATLVLSNNSFDGSLPDTVLGNLTQLAQLDLSNNRFEGQFPQSILNISSLTFIDLSGNRMEGPIPEELCVLSTSITFLSLGNNRFSGGFPSSIQDCSQLSILSLRNNSLRSEIPPISNLSFLQTLDLSLNSFFGPISDFSPRLQFLDLSYNQLNGSLPDSIGDISGSIQTLNLQGNSFSGELPSQIAQFFPLEHLDFSSNLFQGPIPDSLNQLSRLQYLNLSNNQVNGTIPSTIQNLNSLQTLDLSSNSLNGSVPSFLGEIGNLKYLNISSNKLSGEIPSSLALKFNSSSFEGNSKLCGKPLTLKCHPDPKFPYLQVILGIIGGLFLLALLIVALWFCFMRSPKEFKNLVLFHDIGVELDVQTLIEATNNFDNSHWVGGGGFGDVFWAIVPNSGLKIAVKKMSIQGEQGDKEFFAEMNILGKIRHRNLVSLIGAYPEKANNRMLIYEYMENGSLEILFSKDLDPGHPLNSWNKRMEIALGIARGLCYLHHQCRPRILHRDLKPSNVLLDNDFLPCIADFGLARFLKPTASHHSTQAAGTVGYMSVEYARKGKATEKSDVYALGIILLQIVSGKRPTNDDFAMIPMRQWVEDQPLEEIIDPRIQDVELYKGTIQSLRSLGLMCTDHNPRSRPSSSSVLNILINAYNSMPVQPTDASANHANELPDA